MAPSLITFASLPLSDEQLYTLLVIAADHKHSAVAELAIKLVQRTLDPPPVPAMKEAA